MYYKSVWKAIVWKDDDDDDDESDVESCRTRLSAVFDLILCLFCRRPEESDRAGLEEICLILPVAICLSQKLSHACLSISS